MMNEGNPHIDHTFVLETFRGENKEKWELEGLDMGKSSWGGFREYQSLILTINGTVS